MCVPVRCVETTLEKSLNDLRTEKDSPSLNLGSGQRWHSFWSVLAYHRWLPKKSQWHQICHTNSLCCFGNPSFWLYQPGFFFVFGCLVLHIYTEYYTCFSSTKEPTRAFSTQGWKRWWIQTLPLLSVPNFGPGHSWAPSWVVLACHWWEYLPVRMVFFSGNVTLPETNCKSTWTWMIGMIGRWVSFWGPRPIFQWAKVVSFRECTFTKKKHLPKQNWL